MNVKSIKNEIQKDYKDYLNKLQKVLNKYRDTLETKDEIYKESKKFVSVSNNSIDLDKNINIEALKILLEEMEKNNSEEINSMNNNTFYPEVGDPEFGYKIYHKKEFNQNKINEIKTDGSPEDINRLMREKCSGVKTSDTQKLLKNFISPYTPYNSLLIYHGVGVGKTCASISIAENFKDILNEKNKKVYVILPASIKENYRRQIADISKIKTGNVKEIQQQCTKDTYITEKFIKKNKKLNFSDIQKKVNRLTRMYEFMGYEKFVNKIINLDKDMKEGKNKKKNVIKKIKSLFSDSIIIIDEAHNITMKDETGKTSTLKKNRSKSVKSVKSVNPKKSIKKSATKIIKKKIERDYQSEKKTEKKTKKKIIKRNKDRAGGAKPLEEERVEVEEDKTSDNIALIKDKKEREEKLGKQFPPIMRKVLKHAENVKLILLSATPMFNRAEEIVDLVNLMLLNDNRPLMNVKDIFENGEITEEGKNILISKISGYVSYLRGENPINFPQKLDPLENSYTKLIKKSSYPKRDLNNNKLDEEQKINFLKVIGCPMSSLQYEVYKKYIKNKEKESGFFDTIGLQLCNIVCNNDINIKEKEIDYLESYYGGKGFRNIIDVTNDVNNNILFNFRNEKIRDMFELENIKNLSTKMYSVLKGLDEAKGICFIYSQFKWAGVYPLAIALELMGYANYGKNLVPRKYIKNPKKTMVDKDGNIKQLKYLLITGDSNDDFNKYKKQEHNNTDGSLLKVVLGTKAAGEGLNILYVREVHVLEPWFHLNRLEQVIGRGIRNCSHKDLEPEERNVSVYLYAVQEPKNEKETIDMKLYRNAEEKIGKIGKVMSIIKSSAIDCFLNKEGNSYLGDKWNKPIKMIDSRGKVRDNIILEDKPFSNVCNYTDKCEYKCYNPNNRELDDSNIDTSTYKIEFSSDLIREYQEEIKKIFSKKEYNIYFNIKDIKKELKKEITNLKEDIVYHSLHILIKKKKIVKDIYDREGVIIYRGERNKEKYYIFEPKNISSEVPLDIRKFNYDTKVRKLKLEKLIENKELNKDNKKNSIDINQFNKELYEYISELIQIKKNIIKIQSQLKSINIQKQKKLFKESKDTTFKPYEFLFKLTKNRNLNFYIYQERFFDTKDVELKKNIIENIVYLINNCKYRIEDLNEIYNFSSEDIKNKLESNKFLNKVYNEFYKYVKHFIPRSIIDLFDNTFKNLIVNVIKNHLEFNNEFIGYRICMNSEGITLKKLDIENNIFIDCDTKDKVLIIRSHRNIKENIINKLDKKKYGFIGFQGRGKSKRTDLQFKIFIFNEEAKTEKQQSSGLTCGPGNDIHLLTSLLNELSENNQLILKYYNDMNFKLTEICPAIEFLMRHHNLKNENLRLLSVEDYYIYNN